MMPNQYPFGDFESRMYRSPDFNRVKRGVTEAELDAVMESFATDDDVADYVETVMAVVAPEIPDSVGESIARRSLAFAVLLGRSIDASLDARWFAANIPDEAWDGKGYDYIVDKLVPYQQERQYLTELITKNINTICPEEHRRYTFHTFLVVAFHCMVLDRYLDRTYQDAAFEQIQTSYEAEYWRRPFDIPPDQM